MLEQAVLFKKNGQIGKITINRPDSLNALDMKTFEELDRCVTELKEENIRVLIITGSGNKSFVAGADINALAEMNSNQAREYSVFGQKVFEKIENLPLAVIAAINGYALGGGCELALACDIRICSDNAKFSLPELSIGVIPGLGGTQRMPRLLGIVKAKELMFTSRMIMAAEALNIGLVNYVVTQEELINKCNEVANQILKNSGVAIRMCKSS